MSRPIGPPPHRIPEPDSQSRDSAEELREALIDLDRARAHERQMRLQTEGLLEGLRVLTRAENTRQMFDELTTVLQRFVPFEAAFLMQADEGSDRFEVTQSTCRDFEGRNWTAGDMLRRVATGKIVAAFDVTTLPEWQAQPPSVRERVRSGGTARLQAERRVHIHDQDRPAGIARLAEGVDVREVEARVAVGEAKRRS